MHHGGTAEIVGGLIALMLLAAGILALSERTKFPFSIALLLIGIILAELATMFPHPLGMLNELEISADLILYVFLPTLVFESAFHLNWRQLKQNLAPVLTLAVPGLVLSSVIIAVIVSTGTEIPLVAALLLGAILSATDPVAVIALFKRLGAPQRLTVLVEGESLFNDATSIVLARILTGIVTAGALTMGDLVAGGVDFLVVFFGGIVVGLVLAELTAWFLGKVESDPAIEITLTTVLAYLSFIVAEEMLHVSGVMATVTAGLSYGNRGWMRVSPSVRSYLVHFWEYMAFVATALIFLMVGLSVDIAALAGQWQNLIWLLGGMLVSRAVVVFGLVPVVNKLPAAEQVSPAYRAVMYWGGLRGAIALAIVLSLPDSLPFKEQFVVLVVGAVLFTLIVQGLSIDRLVRWLKLDTPPFANRYGEAEAEMIAKRSALQRIPELSSGGMFSHRLTRTLQQEYERQSAEAEAAVARLIDSEEGQGERRSLLQLRALSDGLAELRRLLDRGHLDERNFRYLLNLIAELLDLVRHGRPLPADLRLHDDSPALDWLRARFLPSFLRERFALERVASDYQRAWAIRHCSETMLQHWADIVPDPQASEAIELQELTTAWCIQAQDFLDQTTEQFPEFVMAMQDAHARRLVLYAEVEAIRKQQSTGNLPESAAHTLQLIREREINRLRGLKADELKVEPQELLKKVPLFQGMQDAEFEALAVHLRSHTVAAGDDIIRQNDKGDSLFLIARGVVRVLREDQGESRAVASLMAGDFFGEMALLHMEPRTATVNAVSPCTVYELKRRGYLAAVAEHPHIGEAVKQADDLRRAATAKQG